MTNLTRAQLQCLKSSFEKQLNNLFTAYLFYKKEVEHQKNRMENRERFSKAEADLLSHFRTEVKKRQMKITKLSKIQKKIKKALT